VRKRGARLTRPPLAQTPIRLILRDRLSAAKAVVSKDAGGRGGAALVVRDGALRAPPHHEGGLRLAHNLFPPGRPRAGPV
jgi:hypothetical protein